MKRISLHVLFWLIYTAQDALVMFVWVQTILPALPQQENVTKSIYAAFIVLVPKLMLSYYVLYSAIPHLLDENKKIVGPVIGIVLIFCLCVILYRIIFDWYLYPIVYNGAINNGSVSKLLLVLQAITDIGFVTGAAVAIKLLRSQLKAIRLQKHLQKEKLEMELNFLRQQTNPHFLFNTLNNIYSLSRKQSPNTSEVVMRLSKLLRFTLYEARKFSIPVGDEIRLITDYVELEKIRYDHRLSVCMETEIDHDAEPIAPLLLLPFVENAFKHGVSETRLASHVTIDLKLSKGKLEFRVENSKEETADAIVKENIGLGNVRRQLELMYSDFKLEVLNEPNVFIILLQINLRSHAKL
jgi:sensor histidine kinase YesM